MPLKPLPRTLVKRLRDTFGRAPQKTAMLQRMKNADHRQEDVMTLWSRYRKLEKMEDAPLGMWGGRVRQMNVSRNYPGTELILKTPHPNDPDASDGKEYDAKATIRHVQNVVRMHNERYDDARYELLSPKAYAINPRLIAMSRTDAPNLPEVLPAIQTERGRKMLEQLRRQGFTAKKIAEIAEVVTDRTEIRDTNMLLVGAKKGKLLFLPLVDVT